MRPASMNFRTSVSEYRPSARPGALTEKRIFARATTSSGQTTTFNPGYCSKSGRKTKSSFATSDRIDQAGFEGPHELRQKNACPITFIPSRLSLAWMTTMSLPVTSTSDLRAIRNSSPLMMIPSIERGPQPVPRGTARILRSRFPLRSPANTSGSSGFASAHGCLGFKSSAIVANCSSAASRSATMSAAMISGAGRLALSSRASSFSQKMSRLILSRLISSSRR